MLWCVRTVCKTFPWWHFQHSQWEGIKQLCVCGLALQTYVLYHRTRQIEIERAHKAIYFHNLFEVFVRNQNDSRLILLANINADSEEADEYFSQSFSCNSMWLYMGANNSNVQIADGQLFYSHWIFFFFKKDI